jgi:hypothetical protein
MAMSPVGLGQENDWAGEAKDNCKPQAHPFVREGAPHKNKSEIDGNKNLVMGPRLVFDTETDWLTVSCNLTLT